MILVLTQISNLWKRNVITNETNSVSKKISLDCHQEEEGSKNKKAKKITFSDIVTKANVNSIGKNNPMQLTYLLDR